MHQGVDEDGRAGTVAVAVVLAVLVVLALAGSWLVARDDDPDVAIIGDSITVVSSAALADALGRDHDVTTAAALGVTVEQMQDEAATLAAAGPDQAVIELGSNDVLLDLPLDAAAEQLAAMVATFQQAGARCVHIVDVSTVMVRNDGRATGDRAAELNAATAALAEADPGVVVIGWNDAVVEAASRGDSLVTDTVHPGGSGAAALAELVAASLERGCGDE